MRQVRCTTQKLVAISALPPKAKITADVCSGLRRPKLVHSSPRFSTGQASFDREIAGPKFFDSGRYPAITFVTTALTADAQGHGQIVGDLTFHGVTRPVTLDTVFNGVGPGMLGVGTRLGFSGHGRIKRSDFGVDAVSSLVGDDVDLAFEVEFTRK